MSVIVPSVDCKRCSDQLRLCSVPIIYDLANEHLSCRSRFGVLAEGSENDGVEEPRLRFRKQNSIPFLCALAYIAQTSALGSSSAGILSTI